MRCVSLNKNGSLQGASKGRGFTLAELMVAVVILLPLFTVVVQNFITCTVMNAQARQTSMAVWGERSRMAAIEKTSFDQVDATYDNQTFTVNGITGMGVTYVEAAGTDLLTVYISFTWKDSRGRVYGEDTNLNGQIDGTEDKNGNGRLDSPAGFSTIIYDKS